MTQTGRNDHAQTASVGGMARVNGSGCALCEGQGFRPEGLLHNHTLLSHPPTESGPVGGTMLMV